MKNVLPLDMMLDTHEPLKMPVIYEPISTVITGIG